MTDHEPLILRKTVIGGQTYADDYTVIWRDLAIGRISARPVCRATCRNGAGPAISMASPVAVVDQART
jgi:hypothetical protein